MNTSRISTDVFRRIKFLLQLYVDQNKLIKSLFSKGYGGPSRKIMEIPGGGGSNAKPSGMENPVGWGIKLEKEKPSVEGYGYFLEPHILGI